MAIVPAQRLQFAPPLRRNRSVIELLRASLPLLILMALPIAASLQPRLSWVALSMSMGFWICDALGRFSQGAVVAPNDLRQAIYLAASIGQFLIPAVLFALISFALLLLGAVRAPLPRGLTKTTLWILHLSAAVALLTPWLLKARLASGGTFLDVTATFQSYGLISNAANIATALSLAAIMVILLRSAALRLWKGPVTDAL